MTSKLVRARVAAVLVGLAIAIPASGGAGRISAASKIAIENFGRIDTNYFRGAQPEGRDYADLAALGVKIVINLTSDDAQPNERSMVESAGMKYEKPVGRLICTSGATIAICWPLWHFPVKSG